MDVTQKIHRPLADEHVIGIDPPMRPELPGIWRRRINPFGGRALSDKALTAEQESRSGLQRLQGLALAPGTVEGLEILVDAASVGKAPDEASFQLAPGHGIARSGEDVSVGGARLMPFGDLPVILRVDHADALAGEGAPIPETESLADADGDSAFAGMAARLRPVLPRRLGGTLAEIAANPESAGLPHVGVIVAQPVTANILGRRRDECPPDPRDDPYVDLQRIDGCRLALFLWPSEAVAIAGGPDYSLPAGDPALRNRVAYRVFDNEKLLLDDEMHPWEEWGVPLAVAGFDEDWRLDFVDRFSVARIGGTPRPRTPLVPAAGEPRLWQARIDQFVAHLSELPSLDEPTLRAAFVRMPPVGLLPPDLFDPILRRQHFFPGSFGVSAVPVARSNLELAVREAAPLASFNRNVPDRVELLVPVPDSAYDPHLLEREVEDPRFAEAIAAFITDRALWLGRREAARRRYDRLLESVSGQVIGWPGGDLPLEENCPAPRTQVPVEISRTRRFTEQTAARSHVMMGARASLPVARSDTIWFWVRIHSASGLTGLAIRLGQGTPPVVSENILGAGVFWGTPDVLAIGREANPQARRVGDLPEPQVWHRIEIPADRPWRVNGATLENFQINAVEFAQRGGDVEWGSFGKTDANGNVFTYIGDDAPPGALLRVDNVQQPGWPWQTVPGREPPDVPDFDTIGENGLRRVTAIDGFRERWTQPYLAQELARIDENGIVPFLTDVEARLKATNDVVDLGFVRARADIYRVRQIMLGADAASRLVTSPSLADLASRDEGARATSKGIGEFLKDINKPPTVGVGTTTGGQSTGGGRPRIPAPTIMPINVMLAPIAARPVDLIERRPAMMTVAAPAAAAKMTAPAMAMATPMPLMMMPMQIATFQAKPAQPAAIATPIASLALDSSRYRGADIRRQLPYAGLIERTVTVAERLNPAPAEQAFKYALATKDAILVTLGRLVSGAGPAGIALGDLPAPGYKAKDAGIANPTLAQLLEDRGRGDPRYVDADEPPAEKHESSYFTATVQAIDNSIALMRLVEARVTLFEELVQSLQDLRDDIQRSAQGAVAYLRSVDVEVEEARHDIGTAERLRAEEADRVSSTNARREAVLAGQVEALAWRRVREAGHRTPVATLEIASGLAAEPVAACRQEHEEIPDEIEDYVELLRDAPVKWFPRIAAEVGRIQKLEAARAAIEKMRERAAMPLIVAAPRTVGPVPKLLRGVHQALVAQRRVVEQRRLAVAQVNLAALHTLSLIQAQVQIRETASLADLIGGRHRQPGLTRLASDEMEAIGQVAGCLHAAFGEVAPVIRLGWAEILSEYDRPASLESLAGLPDWAEVPMELRRNLDGFVDWLFGRIDRAIPEAWSAVNELVRIAMLMASHAPVDRIVPARLVAPVPARIGTRLQLAVEAVRIRKGMTALIRDRDNRLISRAVVEDLVDGHASAILTHNLISVASLTADMRIELVNEKA
ncbi:MAG TPA: hypothetical protein VFP12_04970 [Allosphingosinicella sp.]|nr:hypothetical protein [Allosphingosinicella sp.]